jgi:ribosome maturation factor RimP
MKFSTKEPDALYNNLEAVVHGLDLALIEATVSRQRSGVTVRAVVCRRGADGHTGLAECALVHRAIMPRVELAFPGEPVFVEVSSPGLERQIKSAGEFRHYVGKQIACYRTDTSNWSCGVLENAGENDITIRENGEMLHLDYNVIGKARLASGPKAAGRRVKAAGTGAR